MSNKHLLVSFIVVAMAIWMFSGEFAHSTVTADEPQESATASDLPLVRGERSIADSQVVTLDVRSQTRANRTVEVKAEVSGQVAEVPGEKGRPVLGPRIRLRCLADHVVTVPPESSVPRDDAVKVGERAFAAAIRQSRLTESR